MVLVEDVDSICWIFPLAGSAVDEWQLMNTSSETLVSLFSGGWQENKWIGARGGEQKKMRTQQGAVTPPTCRRDPCYSTGRPKRVCVVGWRRMLANDAVTFFSCCYSMAQDAQCYFIFSFISLFFQPQRSEAWEPVTRRKEQHQDSGLRHGLPSGRRQSAGNQLWVCNQILSPLFSDVLMKMWYSIVEIISMQLFWGFLLI